MIRTIRAALFILALVPALAVAQQSDSAGKKSKSDSAGKKSKSDSAKKADPAKRLEKAAALPLFATRTPLEFTLAADFRALSRDRDTLSKKLYPGTIKVLREPGGTDTVRIPVQLRTRGHFRLLQRNCPFIPLRVEFWKDSVKKTPFEGQSDLKLVTHCRDDGRYQQYVYAEEMVYRIHNLVTPLSFRSRLSSVSYTDTTGKSLGKFPAFFIEDERDVARRNGGKIPELRGALWDDLDPVESARFALFEYMIGNTDFSIYALHNVRILAAEGARYAPIAYDFDFSGLVSAHYATPDPRLGIKDVRTRLYRGGCSLNEHVPKVAADLLSLKPAVLAAYDSVPGINRNTVKDAKYFLNEFFDQVREPRELKSMIIDRCNRNPGI
jgi:hypothetical protein